MGPSGTGKTTLLRLITGQLLPIAARCLVFGRDIASLSSSRDLCACAGAWACSSRTARCSPTSTSSRTSPSRCASTRTSRNRVIRNLVLTKLEAVGLRGAAQLMPAELSGGMARRVALARAIVMDPEVLLYDEPFVGLDPISLGVILRLIKQMNQALGITSIVVSHDVHELASIADQSYLMSGGSVVASGTPQELARSDSETVHQFMTGSADGPVRVPLPGARLRQPAARSG